jgi:hypothetical protein
MRRAHRVAYELAVGPIPEGKHICHTCDTPACVNPKHLYVGDPATNGRDRAARGRSRNRFTGPLPKEASA